MGLDDKPQGFDVEVAKIIAGAMGIKPDDITWKESPSAVREQVIEDGDVSFVVATYTINDERKQRITFAGPYYQAGQQLMVKSDNTKIKGPDDLKTNPDAKVCSVTGSTPSEQIKPYLADPKQLVLFDVYDKCANALRTGQVDVVTTDNVILLGFVSKSKDDFKLVGEQFTKEPYGIGIKKGDVAFCEFINKTLKENEDGLHQGLEGHRRQGRGFRDPRAARGGLLRLSVPWHGAAAPTGAAAHPVQSADREEAPVEGVTSNLDLFWSGFLRSLGICLWGMVGALLVGTVIASFRVSPIPSLRWFGTAWVTVIRNCPLTVLLFFFAFGLPEIGINRSFYFFGVSGLVLYTSAFVCEALRAGINSVPAGQAEASRAIGLTFGQSLSQVILPQAFRTSIPPLGSVIIAMFKNSAVVGAFGVGGDLYSVGANLTSAQGYAALPVLTGVAFFYLLITIPSGLLLLGIERKVAIAR